MCRNQESMSAMVATAANDSRIARARSGVMPLMTHNASGVSRNTSNTRSPKRSTASAARTGPEMLRIRHEEGDHAAPVEVIDQLERVDAYLPAVLRVADPGATQPHHGAQGDVGGQIAEGADTRAVGLLEGKDGKAALVTEVDCQDGAAHIRHGALFERRQRHWQSS